MGKGKAALSRAILLAQEGSFPPGEPGLRLQRGCYTFKLDRKSVV